MKNEIILKEGFGDLRFGMQINTIIDLIGKPSEVEDWRRLRNACNRIILRRRRIELFL